MSSSESQATERFISFDEYVEAHLKELEHDLHPFLEPILEELRPIHDDQKIHGAICPAALRFSTEGKLDGPFFAAQRRQAGAVTSQVPKAFLSPEAVAGEEENQRSDWYSLGALMYQIITGSPPAPASRRAEDHDLLAPEAHGKWKTAIINAVNACLALPQSCRVTNVSDFDDLISGKRSPSAPIQPDKRKDVQSPIPAAAKSKIKLRDRLPNGSVAKAYSANILDLFGEDASKVDAVDLAVPEGSGLTYSSATGSLEGQPATAGEFRLQLSFRRLDAPGERPSLTHSLLLTVNPDPKSLWKTLPSDSAGIFAKPDEQKEAMQTPYLTILAASLRGRSHAHEGKYRDDEFALKFIETTGWHIFIVADGAGSAKYSRRGSQIACDRTIAELSARLTAGNVLDEALTQFGHSEVAEEREKLRQLSFNALQQAAYRSFTAIFEEAKQHNATPRDFATTYIVVIAKQLADNWFFASFAVGDGGGGLMLTDRSLVVLTRPDSGDFAGQTIFLTMDQVFKDQSALLARTQVHFCKDFDFLAVMTDGITDPIFQSDSNFESAEAWQHWQSQLGEQFNIAAPQPGMEEALLSYLNFPSPGNHDDRTLIVAVPTRDR